MESNSMFFCFELYHIECLSILFWVFVYIQFLFYALPLNILLSVTFLQYSSGSTHFFSFRFRLFSASFFSSLSLCLSLIGSSSLLLFSEHVMLFSSILSVDVQLPSSPSLPLCDLSFLFPPFLFLLSSFSSHDLLVFLLPPYIIICPSSDGGPRGPVP